MSLDAKIINGAVDLLILWLGVAAAWDWWRTRNRAQGFLALAIGALSATVVVSLVGQAVTPVGQASAFADVSLVLFVLSGYALVRFRATIIPLGVTAHRITVAAVVVVSIAALLAQLPSGNQDFQPTYSPLQYGIVLALVAVWCACVTEPAVRLWLAARGLSAVQHSRLRALSYGYLAIVVVLVLAVATTVSTNQTTVAPAWPVRILEDALLVVVVPLLWAGFAPPRPLRRWWRRGEEQLLREGIRQLLLFSPNREVLAERALERAVGLVGAEAGFITDGDGTLLACHNLDQATAMRVAEALGTPASPRVLDRTRMPAIEGADRHWQSVVTVPMSYGSGTGMMLLLAGPYTPLFGQEEAERLQGYSTSVITAVDRVRLTEELNASESRFRSAFEDAPVGVSMVDLEGNVQSANRALTHMTGFSVEELRQGAMRDAMEPDDAAAFARQFADLVSGDTQTYQMEVRSRRADGELMWMLVAASLVRDTEGDPAYAVVLAQDISARRRAEEAEMHARAAADKASQAKSEFLSRMSHELRTPLNAVLGFAELLEMGELDASQREYVTTILRAGNHLLDLINDVLDISRIEEGRLSLSLEPIAVRPLLSETIELLRPLGAAREIVLPADVPDAEGKWVLADHQRVKQVLLNLLSNAVKYNSRGGAVTVAVHDDGTCTRISVADTGVGISTESLPRLFSPFDRLDAARTGVEGTGLGLALSRRLAEGMGGGIEVQSQVGEGSTFTLRLPTAAPEQLPAHAEADIMGARRPREVTRRRTVLYIEDTLSNLRLMEGIVAVRPEINLLPAMQGRLGLELARQQHPELILLDLHLPDVPGEEVLRLLKLDPGTRGIPVVVISADATQRQIDRLISLGAHAYITKPLNVKRVLEVLDGASPEHAQNGSAPSVNGSSPEREGGPPSETVPGSLQRRERGPA